MKFINVDNFESKLSGPIWSQSMDFFGQISLENCFFLGLIFFHLSQLMILACLTSKYEDGSSNMNMSAFWMQTIAQAKRWSSPPDKSSTFRPGGEERSVGNDQK